MKHLMHAQPVNTMQAVLPRMEGPGDKTMFVSNTYVVLIIIML